MCLTAALSKIWGYLSDCSEAEIDEMCRALGLEEVVKSNAGDLGENLNTVSGGERQRINIGRSLLCPFDMLLMDEPTSALDPISTSKIEDLAMELKKDYTIVMVTHNMQQAVRVSDNTAFFLLGEVIEYNNTETLFSIPSDKRTEDYITGRFG